jgi:hypothetical protein
MRHHYSGPLVEGNDGFVKQPSHAHQENGRRRGGIHWFGASGYGAASTVGPSKLDQFALCPSVVPVLSFASDGGWNVHVDAGQPILTTSATSRSKPGKYPIKVAAGSLASKDYAFVDVDGTLWRGAISNSLVRRWRGSSPKTQTQWIRYSMNGETKGDGRLALHLSS